MFSFLFGIIHLFAGLTLQAINYIRQGKFIYAIYDDLSWILVVTGAVLALLSTDMNPNSNQSIHGDISANDKGGAK